MNGFIRLLLKWLSQNLILKIMESKHKELILFIMSLSISIVFGYTLIYNLSDFPNLSGQQIVGIVILVLLLLVFLMGTIFFALPFVISLIPITSKHDGKMDENYPLYYAFYVGKTIFEENEYDLYKKEDSYFLFSRRRKKGLNKCKNGYIRYMKQDEIGEVYKRDKVCYYKGQAFAQFSINKGKNKRKMVTLFTTNSSIGRNPDLDFTQIDKMEFEKLVPTEEVEIKEIRSVVDL